MNITAFRDNLASTLDRVVKERTVLEVSRSKGEDVVVMAKGEYENLVEMTHLLRSPANARRLTEAIADIGAGRAVKRDDF